MTKQWFVYLLFLGALISCGEKTNLPAPPASSGPSTTTIMPLGASRVEGARPLFESYRYELWKDLLDGGWTVDFIGTRTDPASYPAHDGQSFDDDHEGRGGWTSGQILNGIDDWLSQAGAPDIVLFSSPGGNDALRGLPYEQALANVNAIIDILQDANPEVTILIEQLAPARSDLMRQASLAAFLAQMQQDVADLANTQTTATSRVIAVDMATGFTDALLADEVHYNEAGAAFIADRYYQALVSVLEE